MWMCHMLLFLNFNILTRYFCVSRLPHWPNHGAPRHIAWIDASTLLYVCHQDDTAGDAVIRLSLQLDGAKIVNTSHVVSKPLFERLVRLYANPTYGDVLIETTEGHVLEGGLLSK